MVLFPRIVPQRTARCAPGSPQRPQDLLAQSGPQLFDRRTMGQHLEVLKQLVQQTATYELRAGLDLYQQPGLLVHLLARRKERHDGPHGDGADQPL